MEWDENFKLDLLQAEMDRIASTNQKYISFEKERQSILHELKKKIGRSEYELLEKLMDVTELQTFLMIRAVLRVGSV